MCLKYKHPKVTLSPRVRVAVQAVGKVAPPYYAISQTRRPRVKEVLDLLLHSSLPPPHLSPLPPFLPACAHCLLI